MVSSPWVERASVGLAIVIVDSRLLRATGAINVLALVHEKGGRWKHQSLRTAFACKHTTEQDGCVYIYRYQRKTEKDQRRGIKVFIHGAKDPLRKRSSNDSREGVAV